MGCRRWSSDTVRREIAYTLARRSDPDNVLRTEAPWNVGPPLPFPAFRRLMVKTPEMAKLLPSRLGAQPGTRYIEVSEASMIRSRGRAVVALDPGGDLESWRDLHWFEKSTGEAARVTTDPMESDAIVLESLSERAIQWSRAPRSEAVEAVVVILISIVGRVSGVIDADADGHPDLQRHRPVYEEADTLSYVLHEIDRLGPVAFRDRYDVPLDTAKKLGPDRQPSAATIRQVLGVLHTAETSRTCALTDCDTPVRRQNALYCSPAHAKVARARAYRRRQRSFRRPAPDAFADATCVGCGTVLLGAAAQGLCPVCSLPNEKEVP